MGFLHLRCGAISEVAKSTDGLRDQMGAGDQTRTLRQLDTEELQASDQEAGCTIPKCGKESGFSEKRLSPGQVSQLVRESSQYSRITGSISSQSTYKNQTMSTKISGTNQFPSLSLSLLSDPLSLTLPPPSLVSLKLIKKKRS